MRLDSSAQSLVSLDDGRAALIDIVPDRVVPATRNNPARGLASLGLALLTHAGFAALFVLLLQWRDLAVVPEQAIPVEVLAHMPSPASEPAEQPRPAVPEPSQPAPSPAPDPPSPAQDELTAASEPAAQPPEAKAMTARPEPPQPPPPALVAPPPEAAPAASQPEKPVAANTVPETPTRAEPKPATPPPEAPTVITSGAGSFSVAPPAPARADPTQTTKPATTTADRDPAAELAAALPMDLSALPPSFRAVLSGGGQLPSDDYKGIVFGRLGRAQGAIAEARARHLRGHVLVSFAVDDGGKAVNLRVAHSSGTPALDALALQMVREAAPFPPPPPNSQRSFTPALSFGED